MPSTSDPDQLWYYSTGTEVLPDALPVTRFPWTTIGAGGTIVEGRGLQVTGTAARAGYEGTVDRDLVADRVEIQIRFAGATNAPTWAPGTSGHVLWIDDGQRALGVAIGPALAVVDPATGVELYTIPAEDLPGGWLLEKYYQLLKVGASFWELHVDGRRIFQLPYGAGADSTRAVATIGFGWQDATALSSGVGYWDRAEVGINEALPPQWQVDRVRGSMPVYLQEQWSDRGEAVLRATLGLANATRDRMGRVLEEFSAAVLPVQLAEFAGDVVPTVDGWVGVGTGAVSIVRERIRIEEGTDPTYLRWDFDAPINADAVYKASARFILRDYVSADAQGRLGPFLSIRDGANQVSAVFVKDPSNPSSSGWVLSDGNLSGAIGTIGNVIYRQAIDGESWVELYVIGQDRVVLFVNGHIVEDLPYTHFSHATAQLDVRIGRDGNADLEAQVDITDGEASLSYGDNTFRPLFLRRIAERLVFAGGLERNDRLDAWLRHRYGVFDTRGTSRVITEIRRIACDDDAELVVDRQPGSWYLGVTFPAVSPVFLAAEGDVPVVHAEFRALAPNFTPAELVDLIRRYELPTSAIQSRFYASLVTDLTSSTVTTDDTTFDVESARGFAIGDLVTLRSPQAGNLLVLDYDAADPLAADTMDVSVFNGASWAEWSASASGQAAGQITGSIQLVGRLGDRLGLISSGDHVKVTSDDADEDTWVEIYGIATGPVAVSERVHVVGTTPVIGTQAFAEVHGTTADTAAIGNIALTDNETPGALYTIAVGDRESGAYLFDPPLFAEPARVTAVADAATVAVFLLAGAERGGEDHLLQQALNGTTPVSPTTVWSNLRAIPMGYVAAARTITFSGAVLVDPSGTLTAVSGNAGDTQAITVYYITTHLEAASLIWNLTGTTPATQAFPADAQPFHIFGAVLESAAIGTILLGTTGQTNVLVATWTAGQTAKGVSKRRIATTGQVFGTLDVVATTPRWVLVFGLGKAGNAVTDLLELTGTELVPGTTGFAEVQGFATGNVPTSGTITLSARAWRFQYQTHALTQIADLYGWTASGPPVIVLDGRLDDDPGQDATAGTVTLTGTGSLSETTTITDIVDDTITTTAIDGSFGSGDHMRLAP